ncbi:hypothetical protein SO802_027081 [Lithocarpus litseifolius]|uniref:RNase H type-1 domain-containing protein n=1 Tax=Lithocarpus litseifolius TaxID=425828 RepID=A0AAW2C3B1_9ROSI
MEAVVQTFTQLWRTTNGFKIRNMGNHVVLFTFDNMSDVERIIENQPWNFDKHLVVMEKFKESSKLNELTFDKAWFWVQVHDIPVHFMLKQVAEIICDNIGELRRSPESTEDDDGEFIRVCVKLDINLPLCRGRVITVANGEKPWVRFQYERLPNMCYWCGCLSHNNRDCEVWIQSRGTLTPEQKQFGPHLRAKPFMPGGKNVFFVPGIFEREASKMMKTKVAEVNNGVPMEVGVQGSDTVEKETGRVDSEEAKSHNDVTASFGKQSMVAEDKKETEILKGCFTALPEAMNLLVWNCRGLENPWTKRELVEILREKDHFVVFIAETWADEAWLERTLSTVNFDQKWVVPRTARGGGLVLFWKNLVKLKVVDSHRYYIDTIINGGMDDVWRFTGFYGESDTARRGEVWDKLRSLNRGFTGTKYTRSRHFENGVSIWERLDSGLANNSWFLQFPRAQVVTDSMNDELVGEFQEWEVAQALKHMAPLKAPGPDGMPPLFYQHFWSTVDGADSVFWPMTEDGQYTSKSGYRFLKEQEGGLAVGVQPEGVTGLWKKIWALDITNKVKHLVWRACKNSLPTKCNLVRRQVILDHHCDRCTAAPENILHAIWSCSDLDVVWESVDWHFQSRVQVHDVRELFTWILDNGKRAELFSVTAWCVWQQRNKIRTHQEHHTSQQLPCVAAAWLAEFNAAQPRPPPRSADTNQCHWKPPLQNGFKVNYDGAICQKNNCSGVGVVIRNNEGLVVASIAQNFSQAYKLVEIEAMAATRAIEFAGEIGVDGIVVEGDSSVVANALRTKNLGMASYGVFIDDARVLERNFIELAYSHTRRESNKVAHGLARLALNLSDTNVWMEDVPSSLSHFVQANIAFFFIQ